MHPRRIPFLVAAIAAIAVSQAAFRTAVMAAEEATDALAAAIAARSDEDRARDGARHPAETLSFFGVEPGMTVVEVLPGGGWYTRVLLGALGADGQVVGADYAFPMVEKLGFLEGEALAARKAWPETWAADAETWRGEGSAAVSAATLGTLPASLDGKVDLVLFVRALHNLARVEEDGGYLSAALADAHRVLKPGGVVGVVQHEARPEMPDAWAGGSAGYLKRAFVVERVEATGFELVGESDVNANPKDQPTVDDFVWRLPPSYARIGDDAAKRAAVDAIGESHRMTLRFRKPE